MAWFRSELKRWAHGDDAMRMRMYPSLERLGNKGKTLFDTYLPRGGLGARLRPDRERVNYYMSPGELMSYNYDHQSS
jgi:hypothetical protein